MIKKQVTFIVCLMMSIIAVAQDADRKYSTYYYQRASHFETLTISPNDIIFVGNSITDGAEWGELFSNPYVKNRGISGDTTWGLYDRLDVILKNKPSKIFLLIGINDIGRGKDDDYVIAGIERIVKKIRTESPQSQLYVQSILPVNPIYGMFNGHTSQWQRIPLLNNRIKNISLNEGAEYIDLYTSFADKEGKMIPSYTNDGLHLLGKGYLLWKDIVLPFINR